jgi:hypothetical protein
MDFGAIKAYALTDEDINKILGGTVIMTYPELQDVSRIEDIFDKDGRSVLLFLTEDETTGHWTGLIRSEKMIEYFDPYGSAPDADRKWLSKNKLKELDEEKPMLTKLLRASHMKVYFNTYAFQSDRQDINTCGRWVVARLLHRKKTLREFYNMVKKSGMKPDDFVSALTFQILKK